MSIYEYTSESFEKDYFILSENSENHVKNPCLALWLVFVCFLLLLFCSFSFFEVFL